MDSLEKLVLTVNQLKDLESLVISERGIKWMRIN